MENKTEENGCSNKDSEAFALKSELSEASLNITLSSNESYSLLNSEPDTSSSDMTYNDPFEGIIYRTQTQESKLSIQFVSGVFFTTFKDKNHADYMSSVDIDNTNFVSKCTTHIRGAKCEIKLDSHFKTVELCGIGYQMWRSERFPQITRTLFKRLMQGLDSQIEDLSQCEPMTEDETEICGQRDKSTCEAVKTTTDVNIAPDWGVTPKSDVVSSGDVLPSRNVVLNCNTVVDEKLSGDPGDTYGPDGQASFALSQVENCVESKGQDKESVEFTAENITRTYMQGLNMANTLGLGISSKLDRFVANQEPGVVNYGSTEGLGLNFDKTLCNERRFSASQGQATGRIDSRMLPALTSTPIISRQENTTSCGPSSQTIHAIINRIDQLDGGIKAIKRDILQQIESRLDELKSTVVEMIEKFASNRTYANVAKDASSVEFVGQASFENPQNMSSSNVDEGYGDQSACNVLSSSSETQLKTVFTPDSRPKDNRPIPVTSVQHQQAEIASKTRSGLAGTTQQQPRNIPVIVNQNVEQSRRNSSTPRPVPVHITNRNQPKNTTTESTVPHRSVPYSPKT